MSDVNPEQKYAEYTTQDGPGSADVSEVDPDREDATPAEREARDPQTGDTVEPPD